MRAAVALSIFVLGGCSLVLDPGRHMPESDAGMDTGPMNDADLDASDAPDVEPLAPGNVCPQLARVLCEGRARCCSGMTPADCQMVLRDSCLEFIGPVVTHPAVAYDEVRGGVILARAEAAVETCSSDILNLLADRDGLFSTFRGTANAGEDCVSPPELNLIHQAAVRVFSCTTGNGCVDDGLTFTCQPLKALRDPCDGNLECGDDLYCAAVTPMDSECSPRERDGTSCTGPVQCQSLFCNDMTNVCEVPSDDDVWCPDPFGLLLPNLPDR